MEGGQSTRLVPMARSRVASRLRELQPDGERLKEWLGDHYVNIESGEDVNDSRWDFKSHLASLMCRDDRRGLKVIGKVVVVGYHSTTLAIVSF